MLRALKPPLAEAGLRVTHQARLASHGDWSTHQLVHFERHAIQTVSSEMDRRTVVIHEHFMNLSLSIRVPPGMYGRYLLRPGCLDQSISQVFPRRVNGSS